MVRYVIRKSASVVGPKVNTLGFSLDIVEFVYLQGALEVNE